MSRFLAADVQHRHLGSDGVGQLQQQSTLADARLASQQVNAAGHDATAKYSINLRRAAGQPPLITFDRLANGLWLERPATGHTAGHRFGGQLYLQRIPLTALQTLTAPTTGRGTAVTAYVARRWLLSHDVIQSLHKV